MPPRTRQAAIDQMNSQLNRNLTEPEIQTLNQALGGVGQTVSDDQFSTAEGLIRQHGGQYGLSLRDAQSGGGGGTGGGTGGGAAPAPTMPASAEGINAATAGAAPTGSEQVTMPVLGPVRSLGQRIYPAGGDALRGIKRVY